VNKGLIKMIWPENRHVRSQDLIPAYHDAGQFYFIKVSALLREKTLFPASTIAIELDANAVQDIDNEEDWALAETKFRLKGTSANRE
jgi:N-acylneuraminate cytidylyltransferase